jgi:hypothetical protein
VCYSQTRAFTWDEGYHLLAAQLIVAGRRPYLDFCFPQTPLAAYWNSAWIRVFGDTWRTVHAVAALSTSGAAILISSFVLARFPVPAWRFACAAAVTILIASNTAVVQFGTAGQPYGVCLLLLAGAFRLAIAAVDRRGPFAPAACGFFAGAAAGCSLLTAPAPAVLAVWLWHYHRQGNRARKLAWFAAGGLIAWLPVLWLFARGPRQTFFNVIEYMLLYRRSEWAGAARHDVEVFLSLLESPQAIALVLLAAYGLWRGSGGAADSRWREQSYLCVGMGAALAIHVSFARPTFAPYYVLAVPFFAILAAAGLYEAGSRLGARRRPVCSVLALAMLFTGVLAKRLYDEGRNDFFWRDMEAVARQVEAVTPPGAPLLAYEEHVYFLTRRAPPPGMEVEDSHGIRLPARETALFHLLPREELRKRIQAGVFDTIEICEDEPDRVPALGLERLYAHSASIEPCRVFWGWNGGARPPR